MKGIKKLADSSKGCLTLIIFIGSLVALFCGKLDGLAFAGIVSTLSVIYNYTRAKTDIAMIDVEALRHGQ